ncbi:unnamed protein product [Urochloa decumbens]|uniref:Uncharacterized protein n=1 Tax=Urochloa decumbens TaxID=240449 RepID=A0ABC8VB74_9POAL
MTTCPPFDKIDNHSESQWICDIREVFEALGYLHDRGFEHLCMDEMHSFVYTRNESNSNRTIKMFKGLPSLRPDQESQGNQRIKFLQFLEACGAEKLVNYGSFKQLVLERADLNAILKHPFVLETAKQRVTSILATNEMMFGLHNNQRSFLDSILCHNFQGFKWKDVANSNRARFGTFNFHTNQYENNWFGFARFIRNYVEHLRDSNSLQHVDYSVADTVLSDLFPGILGWLYTCALLALRK